MAEQARRFSKGELIGAIVAALAVGFFAGSMAMELRQSSQLATQMPGQMPVQMSGQLGGQPAAQADASPELLAQIRDLEIATAAKPGDQGQWVELGNLYFDTHQTQKSIAAYEKALALGRASPDVLTDLGIMQREAGQPGRALKSFDAALALDPRHENALYNRGVVQLHDLRDRVGAAATWERLVAANPGAKTPEGRLVKDLLAELKRS